MDSVPEENGQDLDDMSRIGDTSENSRLVDSQSAAKMNVFNIVNNILCLIFLTYIVYLCFFLEFTLFSFHPVLMTFGWLLCMVSAINSITPGDVATEWITIRNRSTRHWILQSCGLVAITAGFLVIIVNKVIHEKPHFVTFHSCFGLAAYVLAICATSGGVMALYSLKLKKVVAPVYMKIMHACAGLFTFVTGIVTIVLGLYSGWFKWGETSRVICIILLLLITLLTVLRPSIKAYVRIKERVTYIRSST